MAQPVAYTTLQSSPGPVTIAPGAIQPHMAISDGHIYVVFIHQGNIAVSVSHNDGKSFSRPVIAIDVQGRARGGAHRGPRIGVDAQKRLTVTAPVTFDDAEYKRRYPTADLFFVQSTDGGKTWTKPVQVNEVSKKAPEALHWMVVAPSGKVHVAWLDMRNRKQPGQDIYYATLTDGKVDPNFKAATTVCECCAPGLTVDAAGNPFLAFREGGDKPSREIFARHWTNRGFAELVQVNRSQTLEQGCPMSAPAVAVSADGKKFAVAWKDVRTGEPNVYWAISDTPRFGQESLVHEKFKGVQDHPSLVIDRTGTVWAAWEDDRVGGDRIWVRCSQANDKGRPISGFDEAPASYPVIAAGGRLVAVVYESGKRRQKKVQFRLIANVPGN